MLKEKRQQRNFIIYKRQDQAIAELAEQSPNMEKSAIVRVLIDLGLMYLKKSESAQRLINGESIGDLVDDDLSKAA